MTSVFQRDGQRAWLPAEEKTWWDHITDNEGCVVPLDVLEEMRRVEERKRDEWDRGGGVVSDGCWAVLEDVFCREKTEQAHRHGMA